ncbi:hypothetical protein OSTOST_01497 [Ostertagia ostertagi]
MDICMVFQDVRRLLQVSLIIGGLSTIGPAGDQHVATQHCAIISSTAVWYSTFHFVFIVLAYVVSFISLFIVWRISKKYSRGKFGGDNRLGVMLIITGSSIILVGSESIVMIFIRWNVMSFSDTTVAITYAMPGYHLAGYQAKPEHTEEVNRSINGDLLAQCGLAPNRLIPLGILPMNDILRAVERSFEAEGSLLLNHPAIHITG